MEQVLYKLPDGWKWETLTDVTQFIGGSQPPKSEFSDTERDGYVRLIQIRDYKTDAHIVYVDKNSTKKFCNRDDVMIGRYGPPVFQILRGLEGAYNVALMKAVPDENVLSKDYLFAFLQSSPIQSYIVGLSQRAAGQSGVNKKALENYSIPIPPLTEQKRIVKKLDALLSRIDSATEHLQSKLDLSKQLFDSVLDEFFKLSDCDSVPLTEVVDFIGGSQPPKSQFSDVQKEGYVRLIQIRDYKTDNHIVYVDSASTKKFCTKEDVMIGRYGPPVFQILRGLDGAYNVALMKAVPNEDVLTKDYLFWFLQSPSIQNYVIGISQRAAGQSGVNKKALEKYLIPVPSKTIQNDIVDKVGQLVNKSRNLEAEVTAEITSLNQLKASILDSAFKGEL
ncbi:restriction endonuclease subunit S [Vibrio cholerae]|uniref:restriction endonuclease subunit S n=2 Tax=Vibrio cholerae TaxID=666 RepID=UPI0018F08415|nr:restriction endonuclease subunit S [Vibrio cholerae]MBJ6925206.1 restriction endonuclease subunit S [Vibrio cholerae]